MILARSDMELDMAVAGQHREASMLELDPRVLSVEPAPHVTGRTISPLRAEYSTAWDKSGNVTSDMKNWALLRCTNGTQIANWGSNGTVSQTANIVTTSSGKNVDVVVFVIRCWLENPIEPFAYIVELPYDA